MSRVILHFLRQPFSLFTACSTRHCGTSACCLRWRWEGSLLCLRVGFSFLCGSAGGWAESLSCYFLTSFATSFGRRSARRGFKNRKPIGEVGCCESRMAERSHWWTERWLMSPLFLSLSLTIYLRAAKRKESAKRRESADRSGKYFSTPETRTIERNCRRIFANIWFSQVGNILLIHTRFHGVLRFGHDLGMSFLKQRFQWWSTSKFWPRHELGMSLSFDCIGLIYGRYLQ